MTLTPEQRRRSRELGLTIDTATTARLALHGFRGAGFGCFGRGQEPPRSVSSALSVCVEEAAEPIDLPGDESGQGHEQAGEQGGGVHALTIAPGTPAVESQTGGAL